MFLTRLLSGIVLLAITIGCVCLGGCPLLLFVVFASFVGVFELLRAYKLHKSAPGAAVYFMIALYEVCLFCFFKTPMYVYEKVLLPVIFVLLLFLMAEYVILYSKYRIEQIAFSFLSFVYVPVFLSMIYLVRNRNDGFYAVWLIFIAAWGSDTCAYCVGKLMGKHKMPSKLSPNKTIEGCAGGVIGAALLGFIYGMIVKDQMSAFHNPQILFAVMGAVGSVIAQIGDLSASAIKRNFELKDYGTLIPGHGGIMDRFDSILFTAPVVFLLCLVGTM